MTKKGGALVINPILPILAGNTGKYCPWLRMTLAALGSYSHRGQYFPVLPAKIGSIGSMSNIGHYSSTMKVNYGKIIDERC